MAAAEEDEMSAAAGGEASAWAMAGSLLWYQLSTFCQAVLLSVTQGLRCLAPCGSKKKKIKKAAVDRDDEEEGQSAFYEGVVWHERRQPVRHQFEYKVRYALVNLDRVPSWFAASTSRHHMTAKQARSIVGTTGPVHLLCMPTSVGYEQNPLSVYYCYDDEGRNVVKAIAEVTNTPWGERVTFEFDPVNDKVAKPLHVSPFMDMAGSWLMNAPPPGEKLALTIRVDHPEFGNFFVATLRANKVLSVQNPENFSWLMPHKVALWIYWQAIVLLWKGVAFVQHPKYVDGDAYRKRSRLRDEELLKPGSASTSSSSVGTGYENHRGPGQDGKSLSGANRNLTSHAESSATPRFCSWREAASPPWL